jgi:tetratricopeptide (TPR) repeat protein
VCQDVSGSDRRMARHGESALARARRAEGMSQERLAAEMQRVGSQLGVSIAERPSLLRYLPRWENGHQVPNEDYRRVLRVILSATDEDLGFTEPELPAAAGAQRLGRDLVSYYYGLLDQHSMADNTMGPRAVLPLVQAQVSMLEPLVRSARGTHRTAGVRILARYEERLGWLAQDSGDLALAATHTDRARALVVELDDQNVLAYVTMRRSNIATDAGDPSLALSLADAAWTAGRQGPADLRAVILRQRANALAGLGERAACEADMDLALDVAGDLSRDERLLAPYCTQRYVAAEAGKCWLLLGEPERARDLLASLELDQDNASRRDLGLALSRAAVAYAASGELEQACQLARQAIDIARRAPSARILRELIALRALLRPNRKSPGVETLWLAIGSLMGQI